MKTGLKNNTALLEKFHTEIIKYKDTYNDYKNNKILSLEFKNETNKYYKMYTKNDFKTIIKKIGFEMNDFIQIIMYSLSKNNNTQYIEYQIINNELNIIIKYKNDFMSFDIELKLPSIWSSNNLNGLEIKLQHSENKIIRLENKFKKVETLLCVTQKQIYQTLQIIEQLKDKRCSMNWENNNHNNIWCNICEMDISIIHYNNHLNSHKHVKCLRDNEMRAALNHWRNIRTKSIGYYGNTSLCIDDNLWYGQGCLLCLKEIQYKSWYKHKNSISHLKKFKTNPIIATFKRKYIPGQVIPVLYTHDYCDRICNYYDGKLKKLVLGEQDFSFTLSLVKLINDGSNIIGTSYLDEYNPFSKEKELTAYADDGERSKYVRHTLPSHNGILMRNLDILKYQYNTIIGHGIDATNLYYSLKKKNIYKYKFDIIIFPFPRVNLKRGIEFKNSLLIQGFFNELRINRNYLMNNNGYIHIIVLNTQFYEWDIYNISYENGFILEYCLYFDFQMLPEYGPRDVSGKEWKPKKGETLLCVFKYNNNFNINNDYILKQLNSINNDILSL